jgi:branched-chain amino acid transport system substrate-binding protein
MINAQGGVLGGRKFEIVSFDDKANPQEALVILKQVTDQDIRYVASTISSVAHALSDAVAKYNERNPDRPILFVNFNALDPALTEAKCSFWHFRFEAHTDMQLNALIDSMAKERSIQKVYLLNQDYAYGQAFAKSAKEMLAQRPTSRS